MPYRSDVEAANARIARLEDERDRLEQERARLERALAARTKTGAAPAPPRRTWLWGLLAVAAAGAALLGLSGPAASSRHQYGPPPATVAAALAPPTPSTAQLTGPSSGQLGAVGMVAGAVASASAGPPLVGAIPAPAPTIVPPPDPTSAPVTVTPDGVLNAPGPAPAPDGPVFYRQYWEARVTHTHEGGIPAGTECLITLSPRPTGDAGVASIRCGNELIHAASVSPPAREPRDRGFCWFDGTDLYCAPPEHSTQVCWINTNTRVARCGRDLDLYVHTGMRDPREIPPPDRM